MELEQITAQVKCSFCAGSYFVARSTMEHAVVHTMPYCDKFRDLEPEDFMYECRMVREGKDNPA